MSCGCACAEHPAGGCSCGCDEACPEAGARRVRDLEAELRALREGMERTQQGAAAAQAALAVAEGRLVAARKLAGATEAFFDAWNRTENPGWYRLKEDALNGLARAWETCRIAGVGR